MIKYRPGRWILSVQRELQVWTRAIYVSTKVPSASQLMGSFLTHHRLGRISCITTPRTGQPFASHHRPRHCDTAGKCAGRAARQSSHCDQPPPQASAMLEAENQHLRSLSQRSKTSEQSPSGQPSAGAESAAASELVAEAAVAGPPVASVPRPPLSPQRELPRPCKWSCCALL